MESVSDRGSWCLNDEAHWETHTLNPSLEGAEKYVHLGSLTTMMISFRKRLQIWFLFCLYP